MKKQKIIILSIITLGFFFIAMPDALAWGISSNKSKVSPGGSFNVSISGGITGQFTVSTSGCSSSVGSGWIEGAGFNFNVTAGGSGNCTVRVSCNDCSDDNGQAVSGSDSVSVAITSGNTTGDGSRSNSSSSKKSGSSNTKENNAENLSDDNKLKSLSIDGVNLSPKFDANTYDYTIELEESIEKINIKAEANDSKAKVTGIGEINLTTEDSLQVSVTAENGKVQVYTIKIKYKDSNPIKVKKGKTTYTVVKRKVLIKEFDDYKYKVIKIKGQNIPALYNKKLKITLVGLKNSNDKVYLYRYDSKNNSYVRYREYDFKNIKLILFNNTKVIPKEYKQYTEKINGYNTTVNKLRKLSKYSLLYGMNMETGKKSLYLYDSKENTVQRYTTEAMDSLLKQNEQYFKLCIVLCVIIVIIIVFMIIIIIRDKKLKSKKNKKQGNKEEIKRRRSQVK